jgi:LuxR family maltose regulon positive regulatory protein
MAAAAEDRGRRVEPALTRGARPGDVLPRPPVTLPPAFVPRETKFHPPPVPDHMVARPHLVERLSTAATPLVVLSAPAGSGKTLTVRQWLQTDPRPVVWLRLDAGDNDPVTLLQYVARALLTLSPLDPTVLAWLELREPPVRNVILPELVRAASLAPPFALVLDDAHTLQNPQCWRLVEALLEALSPGSSLVICGRRAPPLPVSRLRSQDRVSDYGFPDLAFDRHEVARLLQAHGVEYGEDSVDDLLSATEGWAAAVYLAVLAWRSGDLSARALPSGDRRQIADYLTAEVLAGQSPEMVRFMTRTSLVPQLCPELCMELTGRDDSARLLEAIEGENLFLSPLDDRREWYRYHHLFRELLEAELRRREPHVLPELHRRAAAWFEAADIVADAVDHLLRAGDVADAADLAARRWWPYYLTGRVWTARQWVDMFEVDQILDHEQLRLAAAWVLAFTGEADTSRGLLAGFEPSSPIPPAYEHTLSSRSSVAALRTLLAGDGSSQMLRDARLAVELEGGGSGPWRSFGFLLLGVAETVGGDDTAAAGFLRRASVEAEVLRNGVDIAALGDLSLLAGDGGRWDEAVELALEAARRAASYEIGDYLPSIPARLARDRLNAREGDADAVADMEELFEEAPRDFCPWIAIRAGLLLAEALLQRGDERKARRRLEQTRSIIDQWMEAPGLSRRLEWLEGLARARASIEPLSPAESRVLDLLPTNLTVAEIADRLGVSPNTVGTHVKALHRKLNAARRSELVDRAVSLGLLPTTRPPA